ncbi:hypothetical protein, partial [Enterococcus sp. 8E11_MSG4843]|uniref:hypothetical protein n=1 Tax=Enterococcus sp. 8E11_MSG4843 TaxID=1834190 RepID=UPI001C3D13E6
SPSTVHHLLCSALRTNRSDSQQKTRPSLVRDERVRGTTQILLSVDNSLMIGNGIRRRSLLESLKSQLFQERNSQMI